MNSDGTQTAPPPSGFKVAEVGMPPRPMDKYDAPSLVGDQARKRFHVMVKPGGSTCNLDCDYCFYLSKETLPGGPGAGRMSDETLERFIQQYIAGVTGPEVVFSWQGGEPTLMGWSSSARSSRWKRNTPSRSRKSKMISRPTAR